MVKSKKLTRKHNKKRRKSIKKRYEAKKYIEIFNLAYKCLTSTYHDLFDKDDYLLLSYIKQGIKKGWKLLKDKNIIKEVKCNSLCMTMSILNSTLGQRDKLEQLNTVQKLYLFFISYLIEDDKLVKKEVTLKHAIRKIDMKILDQKRKLLKYELKKDNRNIKKCNKFIARQEDIKKQLLESNGVNREAGGQYFNLDVCSTVDCQYLQEYKMEKGEKWSESYSKFCLNITEIFKGIVWLNMYMLFNRSTDVKRISFDLEQIKTNIDIRKSLKRIDIILIPESYIYESEIFYEDTFLDENRKVGVQMNKYWVYKDFDLKNGTCKKIGVTGLENKHYVVALMSLPYESHWKTPKEVKEKEMYNNFQNFLQGKGPLPKLKEISKRIKKIGDEERYDLEENIENSITLHWVYIHRDRLDDFIAEYV